MIICKNRDNNTEEYFKKQDYLSALMLFSVTPRHPIHDRIYLWKISPVHHSLHHHIHCLSPSWPHRCNILLAYLPNYCQYHPICSLLSGHIRSSLSCPNLFSSFSLFISLHLLPCSFCNCFSFIHSTLFI